MTARISLALVLHNHQPVGNFGHVIAQNHDAAYRPLVDALERHPGVRLGLHYTGPLLEWLRAERPELIERIAGLVTRGQIEIVGGGYDEPVLASLPERDRVGQLRRMGDELERLFGRRPRGAWLAERVWEPDLPVALVDGGYEWTILDDAHFRAASIPEDQLWAPFSTDDQGKRLTVFGTEMGLRYRIPFGGVDDVIGYLRDHATEAGDRVGMMGDDGEKFGAWPTTWEHCWGEGRWVDRFFDALEANASWLTTITPSDWLDGHPPVGRVYIPTGSYSEMGEWALPADEGHAYSVALHDARDAGRPEARWMRGGFWRNFQVKYREINDLHKQMLRTSDKVDRMPAGEAKEKALDHLFQGQSNDCYWHGLFGGIYIAHMRLATYEHLIAAEDAADREPRSWGARVDGITARDLDLDGTDELLVTQPGQVVAIKPSEGAGIGGWDIRAPRHSLTSVMRRRPEAYHQKLVDFESGGGAGHAEGEGGGAASIHDIVKVREEGLSRKLFVDAYERRAGLVHLLEHDTTPDAFAGASFVELGDFVTGAFEIEHVGDDEIIAVREGEVGGQPARVRKRFLFNGDRAAPGIALEVSITNLAASPITARLAVEWPMNVLGGGGNPSAWTEPRPGERMRFDGEGQVSGVDTFAFGNDWIGLEVRSALEPAADAWWSSIDTVSISEDGFERTHQGSAFLFSWPVVLEPGEERTVRIGQSVSVSKDRAVDEGL